MKSWRELAADRWSGGVVGILLMLAFAVQVASTGWAAAAMAAHDPLSVICSASPDGAHRPAEPDRTHDCPCGLLCGAGVQAQDAPAPSDGLAVPIRFAERIERARDRPDAMFAGPVVRCYHARGPPLVSV